MEIVYFHRNPQAGFSIKKVTDTYINIILQNKNFEVKQYYMPEYKASPLALLRNLIFTYKHRSKYGINHVTGDVHYIILALIGCKSILTIHDLVLLKDNNKKISRFFKWLLWVYFPGKIANKIVCISDFTCQEVSKYINPSKLVKIYNSVSDKFVKKNKKFNTEKPIILHIGTKLNKNLKRTIIALTGLNCHLRIIGKIPDDIFDILNKYNMDFSNAVNLTDEDIITEYERCDIVNFPSLFEGFGMPILEGQSVGRVILTSKIEPMSDIGANSVCYVNPYDVQSMRSGYEKLIANKKFREAMILQGFQNVKRFTPAKILQEYIDLYRNL